MFCSFLLAHSTTMSSTVVLDAGGDDADAFLIGCRVPNETEIFSWEKSVLGTWILDSCCSCFVLFPYGTFGHVVSHDGREVLQ
ncbi:hypothetical protein B0T19DRAFT_408706 [Cercophora scortea]|uniref:Uncharacterized protein n=1 Tax=Cercophora scortea TaxID=314031 RepID=A0AAE0J3A8_9PEZI|nr:hypothetical protein B0T19DRAFT_408706 [Cercophora scortea]